MPSIMVKVIQHGCLFMSKLLFRLCDVPDDEAQEVRELLESHEIEFFETYPGNWGISMPGIWLQDDEQFGRARALLDDYQRERTQRVRSSYETEKQHGEVKTLWQSFVENPFRFSAYLGLAGIVLYLSIRVFLNLS